MALLTTALLLATIYPLKAHLVAYVASADSREIDVLELDEADGRCQLIGKAGVGGSVMPLAVSPDHKYLYASLRSEPYAVSTFAIQPKDGLLNLLCTTPLAASMAYLSVDRTGRYLFGASYDGNEISVNRLGPDGKVSGEPPEVIATGRKAHCIVTDPSNRFLFVTNLGDDKILQFRFDAATGAVTPNQPPFVSIRASAGPRHLVFHPNGALVFGTNELDGSVNAYRLAPAGTLTLLESRSVLPEDFKGPPWAADLHLTPDGRFLYASERASSTIAAFRVDAETGGLSLVGHYPTETQPRGFNIDPEGKYLLAVGQKSNGLSVYGIDPQDGTLRLRSHLEVGKNPNWVEIITLPP